MTADRDREVRAVLAFYQEAGVDALLDETPVDRLAQDVASQPAAAPDLMTPAQVAQLLGVAESDVVASLDSGDLKGKKIGSQWRVTQTAVDQFLHS